MHVEIINQAFQHISALTTKAYQTCPDSCESRASTFICLILCPMQHVICIICVVAGHCNWILISASTQLFFFSRLSCWVLTDQKKKKKNNRILSRWCYRHAFPFWQKSGFHKWFQSALNGKYIKENTLPKRLLSVAIPEILNRQIYFIF